MRFRDCVHPYQLKYIRFLISSALNGIKLANCEVTGQLGHLYMGAGKTPCSLAAYQGVLKRKPDFGRALVIAPRLVAQMTWPEEIDRWSDLWVKVENIKGNSDHRTARLLNSNAEVLTINWELTQWLTSGQDVPAPDTEFDEKGRPLEVEHIVGFLEVHPRWLDQFGLIIIDESFLWANPKSKRLKALLPWIESKVVWCLSANPMANDNLLDLWAQYALIDKRVLLDNYYDFREQTHSPPLPNKYKWREKTGIRPHVLKRVAPLTYRVSQEETGVDVPVREVFSPVNLSQAAEFHYANMAEDFVTQLSGGEASAANAGVMTGKLTQITSGFAFESLDDFGEIETGPIPPYERFDSVKIDWVLDQLELLGSGTKVFVPYWFQPTRQDFEAAYKKRFGKAVYNLSTAKDPQKLKAAWNADQVQHMMGHYRSTGHGLNLQLGHLPVQIVALEITWSPDAYAQFQKRIARQGYKHGTVIAQYPYVSGTVDQDQIESIQDKTYGSKTAADFIAKLREREAA